MLRRQIAELREENRQLKENQRQDPPPVEEEEEEQAVSVWDLDLNRPAEEHVSYEEVESLRAQVSELAEENEVILI